MVCLVQWFLTVQQFYPKIVKCLGPLDQADVFFSSRKESRKKELLPLFILHSVGAINEQMNAVDCVVLVISCDRVTS